MAARTFSSVQVCRAAGITYRQLDYWTRVGVLRPPMAANGSGTSRAYSELELNIAAVVRQLSALGAGTVVAGEVAETLRMMWELDDMRGIVYIDPSGSIHPEPCAACWCIDLDAARVH